MAKHRAASRYTKSGLFSKVSSFDTLEKRIESLPTENERGAAFEVFIEAFCATQKSIMAKNVWPGGSIPQTVLTSLGLPHADKGVDGVFETTSAELHAYQAKFRSKRVGLTWDNIATFMGLSDRAYQRVLFTNTSEIPSAKDIVTNRKNYYAVRGPDLDRLDERDFLAIESWLKGKQKTVNKKFPRPHQQAVLDDLQIHFKDADRGTTVMACGTGKTLVSLWTAEALDAKNVLVLLPSLALVRQVLSDWLKETRWDKVQYLCVCSDPTVKNDAMNIEQGDVAFPVSTDSEIVHRFVNYNYSGTKIIFSTYQSSEIVAEGLPDEFKFDVGVFDEAHKTAGRENTRFAFALKDENIPIKKRLFCTATPRHYDVNRRDKEGDAKTVYSMDVPDIYGPIVHTLTFAEAAEAGIICNYRVIISIVTNEMLNEEHLKKGEVIINGDVVAAEDVARQVALKKAVEKYNLKRAFTFHSTVKAAQQFTSEGGQSISNHLPHFETFHVSGTMATSARDQQLKSFVLADRSLISNARCLTEGVDIPAVDLVAFMSPKKSKVDIVQAAGRAMRKDPKNENKDVGYIMVPLFVQENEGETIQEALDRTDFQDLWDVLQALQEHDGELADIISELRGAKAVKKRIDSCRIRQKISFLGPEITIDEIESGIISRVAEVLGTSWDDGIAMLKHYIEQHGHARVPQNHKVGAFNLGIWVSSRRKEFNSNKLSEERIAELKSLEGWVWDPLEADFQKGLKVLKEYIAKHGHARMPKNHKVGAFNLGGWVSHRRRDFRANKLSDERIAELMSLEGWVWDRFEADFQKGLKVLKEYIAEHGNARVPRSHKVGTFKLGAWVRSRRNEFNSNKLSDERIAELDALGG